MEFEDGNGYGNFSDCTANSESIFQLNINSTMFDTTADNNSNGESVVEGKDLNVSAKRKQKE